MNKLDRNPEQMDKLRSDFYLYTIQYEERKNISFLNTFPEYEELFNKSKESHNRCQTN
jgi:hypothetical protein